MKTDNIKTNLEKELKFIVEGLCISAWESMNNTNFNYGEFAIIRNTVGCDQCLYNHKCRAVELENKIFKIEQNENNK